MKFEAIDVSGISVLIRLDAIRILAVFQRRSNQFNWTSQLGVINQSKHQNKQQ